MYFLQITKGLRSLVTSNPLAAIHTIHTNIFLDYYKCHSIDVYCEIAVFPEITEKYCVSGYLLLIKTKIEHKMYVIIYTTEHKQRKISKEH